MKEHESGALPMEDRSEITENRLTPSDMGVAESCAVSCADLRGMKLMSMQEAEFLVEFECTEKSDWRAFIERTLRKWSLMSSVPEPSASPPSVPLQLAPPQSAHPVKKQVARSVQGEVGRLRKRMKMPATDSLWNAHVGLQCDL